jgi:hypothetical protein
MDGVFAITLADRRKKAISVGLFFHSTNTSARVREVTIYDWGKRFE